VHLAAARSANNAEREFVNLGMVRDHLEARRELSVSVPRPMRSFHIGKTLYNLETVANGVQFSRRVRERGYFDNLAAVQCDFGQAVEASLELTEALASLAALPSIAPNFYEPLLDEATSAGLRSQIEELRYFAGASRDDRPSCVQHGDFSVENIFLDEQSGRLEIIDWTDAANGFPPLYDIFLLFCSSGYLHPSRESKNIPNDEEFWAASFEDLFLSDHSVSKIVGNLLSGACKRVKISPDLLRPLLVEFLIIRMNFCRLKRSVSLERACRRQLELLLGPNGESVGMSAAARYNTVCS